MELIREVDYGTPARVSETLVTLEIDGKAVTVPVGTSVMRAAAELGVQVPKLCASDNLEPFGSCRLCLIEVEGRRGTPASCTTAVEPGMKVRTQSPKLAKLRLGVMELYASDHPREMLHGSGNGQTEFQEMVAAVGLREVRYGYAGKNHLNSEKDESNPYFTFDPAMCIVCSRCVRACEEVQGTFALNIDGRGFASMVSAGDKAFIESECVSLGACVQAKDGRDAIGGIPSSRCTNEETYLVQKMIRAAFGNNNTDTCARVCHSPTGYGLKTNFGTSAGTQNFDSVEAADVIMIIGANPTDAHPVFASQMKRRLREGARLIIVDPRRIDLVRSARVKSDYHLPLLPGTNVAMINALAHVVVTEGLVDEEFVKERCDLAAFEQWRKFVAQEKNSPEAMEKFTGVPAADVRAAARLYATGGSGAIYYGLGVTEHSQGSTMVMGMCNLAMATGNIGKNGVGIKDRKR